MVKVVTARESSDVGRPRPGFRRLGAIGLAAVVSLVLAFVGAVTASERLRTALMERSGAKSTESVLAAVAMAPLRFARATIGSAPLRTLKLDVKFKHMHLIHEQRDAAIRSGLLVASDDDFVPAGADFDGRTVAAKVRLSGNRPDLLAGEKWPLRLHTKGDGHAYGLRRLEIFAPPATGFHSAAAFLEQLRDEDVLAPRSFYLDLFLNGKHIGLMTAEESPAIEMLANQQRRDGPLLRFDSVPGNGESGGSTAIAPLRPRQVRQSKSSAQAFETATGLLTAFLDGEADASEVFDVALTARFLALVDAWGAGAALHWQQLVFYFNPLTARLEPVGRLVDLASHGADGESVVRAAPFAARLLADPPIDAAFRRALARITGEMLEPTFAAEVRAQEATALRNLHREYPLRLPFDAQSLKRRVTLLHQAAESGLASGTPIAQQNRWRTAAKLPLPEGSLSETLAAHRFLSWDATARELRAEPGTWEVEGSLNLPQGVGLRLPAGTVLRFQAREGLIARGPLEFQGSADAPIVLEGPAATKKSRLWSGVYVIESTRPSRWSHVVVRNTGGFKRDGWSLASGVVFRKAPIELESCTFSGDRTDDALNVIRSSFALRDVEITESESDGFDADYSQGSVTGGSVARAGGDGIDLGGSTLTIRDTRLTQIRDKAISVGEYSRLFARGLTIERVGIGVASKNGSTAEIEASTVREAADVGLVAYMNRPEFGPGTLEANGNRITGSSLPAIAQLGNRVVMDGSTLRPVDAAIDRLYKD